MSILNEMSVSLLIMSHLSDAQELNRHAIVEPTRKELLEKSNDEINFAKFVMNKHRDLNEIVDADILWNQFMEWKEKRK